MTKHFDFKPFPGLSNPHMQTIMGALANWQSDPISSEELIELSDGDQLSLVTTKPEGWHTGLPTVLLVHGMCGSHLSPYLVRMARKLNAENIRAIRLNLRGCGSGLAKKSYHGGVSDDLLHVIKHIHSPDSPLIVLGFSLGGNILLKLAGEMGSDLDAYVEKIIAVCPSVDLEDSAYSLQKLGNRVYHQSFLNHIIKEFKKKAHGLEYKPQQPICSCTKLIEFDEHFTAPSWGFDGAIDYYRKCSSLKLIPDIGVPTHILVSNDDPIINPEPLQSMHLPQNIDLFVTDHGGHMGYLGHPGNGDFYWMDSLLMHWIK